MADTKISALSELAAADIATTDVLPIVDTGVTTTKKITAQTARLVATATVAAHATTSDIWVAREIILSGAAVTFTDIADAPYVGAVAWVKQNAAHIWTDGAVFDVQGGANYTAAASDWIRVYATTVSTFEVTIFRALSNAQGSFTVTLTGVTGSVTGTAYYSITNNVVTLDVPALTGTSNTTASTITGTPNALKPVSTKGASALTVDNSGAGIVSRMSMETDGTMILYNGTTPTATFTGSGTKGLGALTTLTYTLN